MPEQLKDKSIWQAIEVAYTSYMSSNKMAIFFGQVLECPLKSAHNRISHHLGYYSLFWFSCLPGIHSSEDRQHSLMHTLLDKWFADSFLCIKELPSIPVLSI